MQIGRRVVLALALSALAPVALAEEPVPAFEALMKRATDSMQGSREVYFNKRMTAYSKRRLRLQAAKFDVKKTDSLVTPVLGLLTLTVQSAQSPLVPEKETADAAKDEDMVPAPWPMVFELRYSWNGSGWKFLDGVEVSQTPSLKGTRFPVKVESAEGKSDLIGAVMSHWILPPAVQQ